MQVLPLYAALLSVLFVALSIRTIRLRRSLKIGLGNAENEQMLRAMRVHANFAEYVPLSLVMLYLVEGRANPLLVHGLCICLLIGRLLHAFGVSQADENYIFRVIGMAMTFTTLLSCSIYLLFSYVPI